MGACGKHMLHATLLPFSLLYSRGQQDATAVVEIYTLKLLFMCRSHQQQSNGGLVISGRRL